MKMYALSFYITLTDIPNIYEYVVIPHTSKAKAIMKFPYMYIFTRIICKYVNKGSREFI